MKKKIIPRLLPLLNRSFFLLGPRGTGKSTWLRNILPQAFYIDLLDASVSLYLTRQPHDLEALVGNRPAGSWVVLDEIQKIPALLDEVHRLMELRGWKFVLCGSSARKLRRSGVNLLAGRAVTKFLGPFSSAELGDSFNLKSALEWGCLPAVYLEPDNAADILSAYVHTYVREEIREEGIVRKEPPFLRFLNIAGLLNGQVINGENIAREASVPRSSVDVYFSILIDTLLGHFLPAWRPRFKAREQTHPKFFWFDPGVARAAASLLLDPVDRLWKGCALETLVFHELRTYNEISQKHRLIAYYRSAGGSEIDFVIETRKRQQSAPAHVVCIEVKLAERWNRKWEKSIRALKNSPNIKVDRMFGVYNGNHAWHFDEFDVVPVKEFFQQLHSGRVF